MAYRDDEGPLKERLESLSKALDEVRSQSRVLSAEATELEKELEAVRTRLEPEQSSPPLGEARVASPCPSSWDSTLAASLLGACACALLSLTAIGRVMTSEISPVDFHRPAPALQGAPQLPVTSAVAATPSPPHVPGMGFVRVEAPEGARIFEGEHFLGTAPLTAPMEEGLHVYRALHPRTGLPRVIFGNVRERGVTTIVVDFGARPQKVDRKVPMPARIAEDPTNTL